MPATKIDIEIAKDKEAAQEYNKKHDEVYSHPMRYVDLPNGKKVSLLGFWRNISRKLQHLDNEELDKIHKVHRELKDKLSQMGFLKRRAFKLKMGKLEPGQKSHSLLEPVKAQVLEMYGKLYSEEEIIKKLADQGLPVTKRLLDIFRQKNKTDIEKMQHEYELDWRSVAITRKRSRLDQLSYIYNVNKQEFDSNAGAKQLPFSREMRAVLDQVRKEIEGDTVKLSVDGKIDINSTIEINKTTEELYSQVNFLSLLIGRVAARFKVDPNILYYRVMNSWYNKFSGAQRNDKFKELTPEYPSSIVYNWDSIKEKHESRKKMYEDMAKGGDIQDADVIEKKGEQKKTMKELLREKMKNLDNEKERI